MFSAIKDNLIAILSGLLLLSLIFGGATCARLKVEQAEHATTKQSFAQLAEANRSNYDNLVDMTERYNALVKSNQIAATSAANAASAARTARQATAKAESDARTARAAAARANAALADYLESGMPADLACVRWPESCR